MKFRFFSLALMLIPILSKAQYKVDTLNYKYNGVITPASIERDVNYFFIYFERNSEIEKSQEYQEFLSTLKSLKGLVPLGEGQIYQLPNSFFWDSTILTRKERKEYLDFFKRSKWIWFINHPVIYYRNSLRIPIDKINTRIANHVPMSPEIRVELNPYDKIGDTLISRVSKYTLGLWFQKRGFRILREEKNFHYYLLPHEKIESQKTRESINSLSQDPLIISLWFEVYYPNELESFE